MHIYIYISSYVAAVVTQPIIDIRLILANVNGRFVGLFSRLTVCRYAKINTVMSISAVYNISVGKLLTFT